MGNNVWRRRVRTKGKKTIGVLDGNEGGKKKKKTMKKAAGQNDKSAGVLATPVEFHCSC